MAGSKAGLGAVKPGFIVFGLTFKWRVFARTVGFAYTRFYAMPQLLLPGKRNTFLRITLI
ncbi:hypothetical protein DXA61_07810 [Bacteroides intestinalis]|nr:hypothetical protein DXA61_07810 [Bacteroides intestinalis]